MASDRNDNLAGSLSKRLGNLSRPISSQQIRVTGTSTRRWTRCATGSVTMPSFGAVVSA